MACYTSVLADAPQNVEALTYRGWVRFVSGDAQGIADLHQAVQLDGNYPDVHAFLAIVLFRAGCVTDAQAELQRARRVEPVTADRATRWLGCGRRCKQALANPASRGAVRTVVVERRMIRLGGGQGFYGDGHDPVADVLAAGVDYLVCEALGRTHAGHPPEGPAARRGARLHPGPARCT